MNTIKSEVVRFIKGILNRMQKRDAYSLQIAVKGASVGCVFW